MKTGSLQTFVYCEGIVPAFEVCSLSADLVSIHIHYNHSSRAGRAGLVAPVLAGPIVF